MYGITLLVQTQIVEPQPQPTPPPYSAPGLSLELVSDRDLKSYKYMVGDAKYLHKSILGLFQKCYSVKKHQQVFGGFMFRSVKIEILVLTR